MKTVKLVLLGMFLTTFAEAKECFILNAPTASEADKICFTDTTAELYARDGLLLERIAVINTSSVVNIGHGVYWNLVLSSGKGLTYQVKATRHSGAALVLDYVRNLKTGEVLREYKPSRVRSGRTTCNGRGRCI